MNLLQVIRGGSAADAAEPVDLQAVLLDLDRFGGVALYRMSAGWFCRVEVHTTATGAEFKVGSEHRHPTPAAAAIECRDRLRAALASITRGAA